MDAEYHAARDELMNEAGGRDWRQVRAQSLKNEEEPNG